MKTTMTLNNSRPRLALAALLSLALPGVLATGVLLSTPTLSRAQEAPETPKEAPKTKRVMVATFLQLDRKVKDNLPVGQEVADMVTQALVLQGARVVERAELAVLEKERGLQSGTADKGGIQELAKLKGAAVAVMGKVTEFNIVEKPANPNTETVKSLVGRIKPLKDKAASTSKPCELRVSLDVRLVSVETGDILAATSVLVTEGTDESDVNTLLSKSFGGGDLLKLGLSAVLGSKAGDQSPNTPPPPADKNSAWNESTAGKCTQRAVQQLVVRLMDKIPLSAENDFEDMKTTALQFQGLGDYSEATQIVEALTKLKGIASAELKSYTPEMAEITVRGSAKTLKGIVGLLQNDEALKAFNLKVASATQESIVFKKG